MTTIRRTAGHLLIAAICAVAPVAAQQPAAESPTLTIEQQETFLRTAEIQSVRRIGEGTTGAQVATLSDGEIIHDAQVQTVDESRASIRLGDRLVLNFVDSYRYNIAAYRMARALGIDNVPVSVKRRVGGRDAAVTWWLDDVVMDEGDRLERRAGADAALYVLQQRRRMRVFDELIWNWDRNTGNMLWTSDWTLWMIDHTRAFRRGHELRVPSELLRIERSLLDALRTLTIEGVREAMDGVLRVSEIEALMARRDLLLAHYDTRIAERGRDFVLYTIER